MSAVWYVAYGSNTTRAGLRRYTAADGCPTRWVRVPHALRFGGTSLRWEGGVAFLDLGRAASPREWSVGRAYRLRRSQLREVAEGENALAPITRTPDPATIPVGGWARLPLPPARLDSQGKYDALLRLHDVDGEPAVTLTTGRVLPGRPPSAAYLGAIRAGLAAVLPTADLDGYLTAAVRRATPEPS